MEHIPLYVTIVFILTVVLGAGLLWKATNYSRTVLLLLLAWLGLQAAVGLSGFYTVSDTLPPRFALLVLPPVVLVFALLLTKRGKQFIDQVDVKALTLVHLIRIPVEICLYWLCLQKVVPEIMTFEGRNLDILSGITAPLIWYFGYVKQSLGRGVLIAWNCICLLLLVNVVSMAILSAPFRFQQFSFDQPNSALLYFPYVWLPGFLVPAVLFAHVASLRQLIRRSKNHIES